MTIPSRKRRWNSNGVPLYDPDALVASVCVCMWPKPDRIGQCQQCGRPHHPDNAVFMSIRLEWRTSGIDCEPDTEEAPSTQLSMFPKLVPDRAWP